VKGEAGKARWSERRGLDALHWRSRGVTWSKLSDSEGAARAHLTLLFSPNSVTTIPIIAPYMDTTTG